MLVEGGQEVPGNWEKGVVAYLWGLGEVAPEVTLTSEQDLGTGVRVRIPEVEGCCKQSDPPLRARLLRFTCQLCDPVQVIDRSVPWFPHL